MTGKKKKRSEYFRPLDLFIVIFFLSIAALSLLMFWLDLMHTINLLNVEPVGYVIVKQNTVQRRHSDRVLWDRLANKSPVYIGNLIRVAEISSATLNIENNSLDLEENTFIRIMRSEDGEGLQIILSGGNLSLITGSGGKNVDLDINGRRVQVVPGSVLRASSGGDGRMSVRVNSGSARVVDTSGAAREISAGNLISMNADGTDRPERAAVVTQPSPNVRYLKSTADSLPINFLWNRINLSPDETLRMEISPTGNFTQISRVIDNLDNRAQAQFDTGLWFWRLSYEDTVLADGRVTVVDSAGPQLLSPAANSVFRFTDELPTVNFRWTEVEEATSYIVEISASPDFSDPMTGSTHRTSAAFMSDSRFDEGTWYWRVMPLFPSVFAGSSAFSNTSFFHVAEVPSVAEVSEEEFDLARWLAEQAASDIELPPEILALLSPDLAETSALAAVPPQINLRSPATGTRIAGLTALRQQTVFTWETEGEFVRSRFVLSRNANPLQGQPARQIQNPGTTTRIDRLGEGTWYWTVELQTADGAVVSAPPRSVQILAVPQLPSAQSLLPAAGTNYTQEELQSRRGITFNWSAVQGANAYVFTLYRQTGAGRQQVTRATVTGTSYTFSNINALDGGNYVWQIEPVNRSGSNIDQRGRPVENNFTLEILTLGSVEIDDAGILYGN